MSRMPWNKSLTGQRFNRLVVIGPAPKKSYSQSRQWKCKCDCGKKAVVATNELRRSATRSCGCWRQDRMKVFARKHGLTGTPMEYMYRGAKRRAKKEGVPFSLTAETMPSVPEKCPVFGIKLSINTGGKRQSDNSPTLDRILPWRGYTSENVRVISWKANRLKSKMTLCELQALCLYVETGGRKA